MKPRHLALLLLAPFAATAGDGLSVALQAAQAVWPQASITPQATQIDTRCANPVIADAPTTVRNGITQVRLRCTAAVGWTRYLALRVEQTTLVAVLRAPLAQGAALTPEAVDWQPRDAFTLAADVLKPSSPIAVLSSRRALAAGSVLAHSQFTAPKTIARGQAVTLVSRAAGMEVRAPGEALADAVLGARVRVRNNASRRVVEGIAKADGTVEVTL